VFGFSHVDSDTPQRDNLSDLTQSVTRETPPPSSTGARRTVLLKSNDSDAQITDPFRASWVSVLARSARRFVKETIPGLD